MKAFLFQVLKKRKVDLHGSDTGQKTNSEESEGLPSLVAQSTPQAKRESSLA